MAANINSRGTIYGDHGTSALGEMIAQHNGFGVNGRCPDAVYGIVGLNVKDTLELAIAKAIDIATDNLNKGMSCWLNITFC